MNSNDNQFLAAVQQAFPSAQWVDSEREPLPVYVVRHGSAIEAHQNKGSGYSPDYPFVGNAKRFDICATLSLGVWKERLIPWPWFVVLVAAPDDTIPEGLKVRARAGCFNLVFVDQNGAARFHISRENSVEVMYGFATLRSNDRILLPSRPSFIPAGWNSEMIGGRGGTAVLDYVEQNGTLISCVPRV